MSLFNISFCWDDVVSISTITNCDDYRVMFPHRGMPHFAVHHIEISCCDASQPSMRSDDNAIGNRGHQKIS